MAFVDAHDLPRPEFNATLRVAGRAIEPDALWREQRLVVEVDGGAVHRTRRAFESDRERDRILQVRGWRVVRVTSRQMKLDGPSVARDLRALLALSGGYPSPP